MNRLIESQCANNRESKEGWGLYQAHRNQVTEHLRAGKTPGGARLCVLGAGNCNDLDLGVLRTGYREIHLVDLDAAALADGVARQGLAADAGIHCHGGVDVTGVLDQLAGWSPGSVIPAADLAACVEEPLRRAAPALPGPFTVAASTCLLSQLINAAFQALGASHPHFLSLIRAVRTGHLRLLNRLIAPGGRGVLITDFVSSQTVPNLAKLPESALESTLVELIRQGNFFHGLNPFALIAAFRDDPVVGSQATDVQSLRPWRWNLGPRLYAVWGLKWRRQAQ
jgi:hypothetical protein